MKYQAVIGLEIHTELNTRTKMFCSCSNNPEEKRPNFNICPVCTGQPGVLPVINGEAVKKVIKTGLALNCQIPEYSKFDRKNYFYPDLPKGYQISQYDKPLCLNGFLNINGEKIKIRRIHLEEDTGRLVHPEKADYSLVDFNRAGLPLMELVTEPEITSGKEARQFAEELQMILRHLNVSRADMEKGQLRVEVNISLSQNKNLGTKVEIKNLNSFRAVEQAIDYEIERQAGLLDKGEKIIQETRGWDDVKEITFSQRGKEESHDYRYFPEPDLPSLHFTKKEIIEIKKELPELPQEKRERFSEQYRLPSNEIEIFIQNKELNDYFEDVSSRFTKKDKKPFKLAANYLLSEIPAAAKALQIVNYQISDKISSQNFADFIVLIFEGKTSSKIAKMVLAEMFKSSKTASQIIEEKGLVQISDENELEKIINQVVSKNPKVIADYKKGKTNTFQFLVGQIMGQTKGKANPQVVNHLLTKILGRL